VQEATTAGAGIGRSLHLATGLDFRVQAGVDMVHYDLQDFGRGNEPGGDLQWRLDWKTNVLRFDLVLFHEAEYRWLFDDADVTHLDTRSGLSVPLAHGLVAEIRLDYDRVGEEIPGVEKTESEWVFALGYQW